MCAARRVAVPCRTAWHGAFPRGRGMRRPAETESRSFRQRVCVCADSAANIALDTASAPSPAEEGMRAAGRPSPLLRISSESCAPSLFRQMTDEGRQAWISLIEVKLAGPAVHRSGESLRLSGSPSVNGFRDKAIVRFHILDIQEGKPNGDQAGRLDPCLSSEHGSPSETVGYPLLPLPSCTVLSSPHIQCSPRPSSRLTARRSLRQLLQQSLVLTITSASRSRVAAAGGRCCDDDAQGCQSGALTHLSGGS